MKGRSLSAVNLKTLDLAVFQQLDQTAASLGLLGVYQIQSFEARYVFKLGQKYKNKLSFLAIWRLRLLSLGHQISRVY